MAYIGAGISRFNTADELTVTGDAQIDTTTLVVDSTNNRVGVGTASPATALDVTGTVTADGLTVDGDVTINSTFPRIFFYESDTTDLNSTVKVQGGSLLFQSLNDDGTGTTSRVAINNSTGDISFYASNGTTQGLFWDASTQELGIGTTSPSKTLTVHGNDGTPLLLQGSGNDTAIAFAHSGTSNAAINASSDGAIEFRSGGVGSADEAMRITNGRHFLVGKTSQDSTNTVGFEAKDTGEVVATVDGSATAYFNRKTSDGDIAVFRKDNTTVGTIGSVTAGLEVNSTSALVLGTDALERMRIQSDGSVQFKPDGTTADMTLDASGNLMLGKTSVANGVTTQGFDFINNNYMTATNDGNIVARFSRLTSDGGILEFYRGSTLVGSIGATFGNTIITGGTGSNSGSVVVNCNNLRPDTDNVSDLGSSGKRFQDLYLSGGAYIGGTGNANKLDDYEEGSWTPTVGQGTVTVTAGSARYIKIGNVVTVHAIVHTFSDRTTAAHVIIGGLPYNTKTSTNASSSILGRYMNAGGDSICLYTGGNTTSMQVYTTKVSSNYSAVNHDSLNSSQANLFINHTYLTN